MDKKRFFALLRSLSGFLAFSLLFCTAAVFLHRGTPFVAVSAEDTKPAIPTVVLDAGHGGEDGGAVGVGGVTEKELNLQIVKMLGKMLEEAGVTVVYTRTDDRLLYTEEQNVRGKRKMYDLRNRLAIAANAHDAVLVSIHMNKFSDSRQKGLQVYYATADGRSRRLAESLRSTVREKLQPENRRPLKAAGENIYLLARAEFPAVLVECGFLSNEEECVKLCQENYQRELSEALFCGIMEYINTCHGE